MRLKTFTAAAAIALLGLTATARADTVSVTQDTNITFPDLGYGNPVPSNITFTGVKGTVNDVRLQVGFTASNPQDIDLLLVSPDRRGLYVLSDAGGDTDVAGLDFTFTDSAAGLPSVAGPLTSGTYKPSDFGSLDEIMGMGAPDPPYLKSFAGFKTINPNGQWQLYGFSDFFNGGGSASVDDWTVTVDTTLPDVKIKAKKQRLGGKARIVVTSNVNGTFVTGGGLKPKTVQLPAGVPTAVKAKVKPALRNRLADQLDETGKAKLKVAGTFTDTSGTTDTAKAKVKLK